MDVLLAAALLRVGGFGGGAHGVRAAPTMIPGEFERAQGAMNSLCFVATMSSGEIPGEDAALESSQAGQRLLLNPALSAA